MTKIIGVGDNTVDVYVHQGKGYPGGNAVNVAVIAHRHGHPAAYLGWLGSDTFGNLVLDSLKAEGLDVSRCRVVDGPNSFSSVEVIDGDRVFGDSDHGVCSRIALTPEDYDYIRQFDVVHTSIFSHLEDSLEELRKASRFLSFDFSDMWDEAYLDKVLPYVDIALLSCSHLSLEKQKEVMRSVQAKGPGLVLVTRGGEGATVFDGQKFYHEGIKPVKVVDTLGAGDAFVARFLVEYNAGKSIQEAMELASWTAAENCTWFGAFGYGKDLQN